MKKLTKILALFLYYGIAKHLPNYSFPGGQIYNWIRIMCLKQIISIGKNCRIMRNVYVGNGNNIKIGNNCRINENVRLDNVIIGNHVMIARESILLGKSHQFKEIEFPMEQQGIANTESIVIENDVWLGLRVIVLPGIKICRGSIIGAGAVLTSNTLQYGIYGGVPAKLIRIRE